MSENGISHLTFKRQRQEAKLKLGPRFNIKEFHTVVLQNGAVPLSLLDRLVDNYIEDTQRGD